MQFTFVNDMFEKISKIFRNLLLRDKNLINQARIKMLAFILVFYLVFTGILIVVYTIGGETLHLIRVVSIFIITILLIIIVYSFHTWKLASHVILWLYTLAVLTNLSIYVRSINLETMQFIWLSCLLSFYMHELKWGLFYSALNIVPVLIFTAIDDKNYFFIGNGFHLVNQYVYVFVTSYNFFLITFLQYYFFRTFNTNFVNLTNTKNKLNKINKKLKISLRDVENLSNARMDFLSTMSHELRTPLNGVIGISNALLLQNPRKDQEDNLAVLKFSADNLMLLINNVLDFNKFDSDKVKLELISFDLAALIRNNFQSLKLAAQKKMFELNLNIDKALERKYVNSDPTRLTQILSNLVNNAIKFTEKGTVSLDVKLQSINADQITVRFTVEDTGIGIEADRQESVFEAYTQASASTNRNYGGTGLGLPIVKKVLNLFNSEIKLTSSLNVGTKIMFDIDFSYQELIPSQAKKIKYENNELAHLKILVAEDNHVNILVIKKTLAQWNIIPEIAENGIIALEKLAENDFDVILMDLYMPTMNGYETAICIRSLCDKRKAATPIIALSATFKESAISKISDAGINDFIPKPFDPEQLFNKIKELTQHNTK